MNSVVRSSVPADVVTPRATTGEVSLFRLYTLRVAYLIMSAGLGAFIWPNVIHHTSEFAVTRGIQVALLAGQASTRNASRLQHLQESRSVEWISINHRLRPSREAEPGRRPKVSALCPSQE
jgi:hypothetical protein